MKYCWPLVLIGGTLLVLGAALPWARYCGRWPMPGEPDCLFFTGFDGGGLLPAMGGSLLVLIALTLNGEPGSRGLALTVSGLCAFLILGGALVQIRPVEPTYSPAFGLGVGFIGAMLGIFGSEMLLPENDLPDATGIVVVAIVELLIVCVGLALVAKPALGNWLGLWQTDQPKQACQQLLCSVDAPVMDCSVRESCYATATAWAIELTPPAWWPADHSIVP